MTEQTSEAGMLNPSVQTRLAVLLFTDIVGSTDLKTKLGTAGYSPLLARHNELFEAGIAECKEAQVIKHTGDGYFATFPTASDAVRFALVFQSRLGLEPWGPVRPKVRVGIHIGEVQVMEMAARPDVVGLSADVAARLMSLAVGGQILLTRGAFDDARQFVKSSPELLKRSPPLRWLAHGPYQFKGAEEPMDVFEVGIENYSPLSRPADSEKAQRSVAADEEPTLGWRPAVGLEIPSRDGWVLEKKIGEGGFGEVWLGKHEKLKEERVFKFCFDVQRLRSLKREYTLFRLLREALGDRPDIVKLFEVRLEEAPFFLESEYTASGNLLDWAARQGGIDKIPLGVRLAMLAQIADAVAAAHSVGVLHKDLKPSNILIHEESDGRIAPRLSDFGIGILYDRSQLAAHAITETGFTQLTQNDSSRTGTRMYSPPEQLAGRPFTTQGDVYALGVLLYQMVVGDLERPLAQGWERDIGDELLRGDIDEAVEGDLGRRIGTAAEVARRLHSLEERRTQEARQRQAEAGRVRRRRMMQIGVVAATAAVLLVALGGVGMWLHIRRLKQEKSNTESALTEVKREKNEVERQKKDVETERDNVKVVLEFVTQDVFGGATPARIPDAKIRDQIVRAMIEPAAKVIENRFADKPLIEATGRNTLAFVLEKLGRSDLALPHAQAALDRRRLVLGEDHPDTLTSLDIFASVLDSLGRFKEAEPLQKEAFERRRRVLGEDHPDTLDSLNNYAYVLDSLGGAKEAEPLYKDALERRRRVLGEDNPDTLDSLNNYAQVLDSLGRAKEAEPLHIEAMERRRRVLGEDHPDTLMSLNNYASVLDSLGRAKEAEPLYKDALERRRRVLGEDHPITLISLNNYAFVLASLGRFKEAEPLYKDGLDRRRRVLGEDHPDTLASLNNYASVLESLGRSKEAEPLFKDILERCRRVLGEDHPDTLGSLNNYAGVLDSLGRSKEAEPLYKDALDRRRRILGEDHPDTLTSLNNHAGVLDSLGRSKEAEPLYKDALDRRRRILGEDHPDTLTSLNNYAFVLLSLGRSNEGESLYRDALRRAAASPSLGKGHPNTKKYAKNLAKCLESLGKGDEAAVIRKEYGL